METRHIKFTWSSDALATILDTLEVSGLGATNKSTGLYSTWPDYEQWALYTSKLSQWMPNLLSDEERKTLEQKLSSVESGFNAYLSQPDANNKEERILKLRELLKQLEELEALICDRDSHAAYPYFARWFILNIAVIRALMNYETRLGEVQGVKVWWSGLNYLGRVFESAYSARAKQVTINFTGAFNDRIYLKDEQTGTPLTIDVKMGTEDETHILNMQRLLQSVLGSQYIQNISLLENAKILEEVRNAVVVKTDSQTKQEEVFDVSKLWRKKQERIENKIAENLKVCESACNRLINPAVFGQKSSDVTAKSVMSFGLSNPYFSHRPPVQPSQPQTLTSHQQAIKDAVITAYKPLVLATAKTPEERIQLERDFPSAMEVVVEVIPDLIVNVVGMIPVVGGAISAMLDTMFGLFFMFLGKGAKPNPWVEFEKKMLYLIRDQLTDNVAYDIRNDLEGFDNQLKILVRDYHSHLNNMTPTKRAELRGRASSLLDSIVQFQPKILTPASNAYYKVAPYYQHFFLTSLVALEVAKVMGVETVNFVERRTQLYEGTNTYISNAILGIVEERRNDVRPEYVDESSNEHYRIYDHRSARDFSRGADSPYDKKNGTTMMEESYEEGTGLMTAIQLMRGLCLYVYEIIDKDPESSFDKNSIKQTYAHYIGEQHDRFIAKWGSFSRTYSFLPLTPTLEYSLLNPTAFSAQWFYDPDYDVMNKENQRQADSLSNFNKETLKNFQQAVAFPIFNFPTYDPTPTAGNYYYIVAKHSDKALDVTGGSIADGTNIQQHSRDLVDQQMWRLEAAGNGCYYLVCKKSDKVANVDSNNNVIQWDRSENAKWKREETGDGYFYLIHQQTNKALDVYDSNTNNGANVQVHTRNYSDAQKWRFQLPYYM